MGSTHIEPANRDIPHEEVARRAYELWQARGCPAGDGSEDWEAAVAELSSHRTGANRIRHWWERLRRSIAGGDN